MEDEDRLCKMSARRVVDLLRCGDVTPLALLNLLGRQHDVGCVQCLYKSVSPALPPCVNLFLILTSSF